MKNKPRPTLEKLAVRKAKASAAQIFEVPYWVVVLNTPYGTNFKHPLGRFQDDREAEAKEFYDLMVKQYADNGQCGVSIHRFIWKGSYKPGEGKYAGFWMKKKEVA